MCHVNLDFDISFLKIRQKLTELEHKMQSTMEQVNSKILAATWVYISA